MAIKVEVHIPEHVIILADDNKVVITRKGIRSFANRGQNGDQTIPMSTIIGVNFKSAGLAAGQINFVTAAGNQTTGGMGSLPGFSHGAYNKANNVVFRGGANKDMGKLKTFVEAHMGQQTNQSSQISEADEIEKFKKLLDEGTITQAEFDAKKKQILGI